MCCNATGSCRAVSCWFIVMPEGDSLHYLAARLAPLVGRVIVAFESHDLSDAVCKSLIGVTVREVLARGKNLLVRFEDGRTLHIHLRMNGRMFVDKPRSTFWAPRTSVPQLRIAVYGFAVVGARIPVVRLLRDEARDEALRTLGPELIRPENGNGIFAKAKIPWTSTEQSEVNDPAPTCVEVDVDEAVRRLRALETLPIGEAILRQRALAGIGNLYKSETLFLEGVHPCAQVDVLSDEALRSVVLRASTLMRQNQHLPGTQRRTRNALAGSRYWVYLRNGRRCLRCADGVIERIYQGAAPGRSTYFCAVCQPVMRG